MPEITLNETTFKQLNAFMGYQKLSADECIIFMLKTQYGLNPESKESITDEMTTQIVDIMHIFTSINPLLNYGNKTERKAVQFLIEKCKSFPKVQRMAQYVTSQEYIADKFSPTIIKPTQLKNKLGELLKYYESHKPENKKGDKLEDYSPEYIKLGQSLMDWFGRLGKNSMARPESVASIYKKYTPAIVKQAVKVHGSQGFGNPVESFFNHLQGKPCGCTNQ